MRWTERLAWLKRSFPGFPEGGFVAPMPGLKPGEIQHLLPGETIKPHIRWFAGGWWICQRPGTELGRGDSPAAAYHDWALRASLTPVIYGGIRL
jgi:hypothetical protein